MRCSRDWRITVPATGPLQIVADLKLVDGTLRVLFQCVPGKQLQDDGSSRKSMYYLSVWPAFSNFWRFNFMQHESVIRLEDLKDSSTDLGAGHVIIASSGQFTHL